MPRKIGGERRYPSRGECSEKNVPSPAIHAGSMQEQELRAVRRGAADRHDMARGAADFTLVVG